MTDTTEVTTTETTETTTETEQPKKVEFSTDQSEWISRKIAAEVKSDREKRALADADAKKKVDAEAERKRQVDAGEFTKVQETETLTTERDTAVTALETATTELTTLREYVATDVAAITKAVKEEKDSLAARVLMGIYPGDDAGAIELLAWAKQAKPILSEITSESANQKTSVPGAGKNPPAAGSEHGKVESPLSKRQILS